jgi:uroporphyrinogen decarboxylase
MNHQTFDSRERFLAAARCEYMTRPPLWIMRQAGRYLPEYRALREKHSFRQMVHDPELAAEVTMQPMRRFALDAAIVFSDIMAVPEALGMPYELVDGEGIRMERRVESILDVAEITARAYDVTDRLDYVAQALRNVRSMLGNDRALLGFAGSPWTLACYMCEGGGARGDRFRAAAELAHDAPMAFDALMSALSQAVAAHLRLQISAGADAVQIFDSWAAAADEEHYKDWSLRWVSEIVESLPGGVPVILYARGRTDMAAALAATGVQVVSADEDTDLADFARSVPADVAVQGNLDPEWMEGDEEDARKAAREMLDSMRERPGYIANLGHGIRPGARVECVQAFVEAVHECSAELI